MKNIIFVIFIFGLTGCALIKDLTSERVKSSGYTVHFDNGHGRPTIFFSYKEAKELALSAKKILGCAAVSESIEALPHAQEYLVCAGYYSTLEEAIKAEQKLKATGFIAVKAGEIGSWAKYYYVK